MLIALLLAACTPDLPAGWEGAEPIADFTQAECEGNPYDPFEPEVGANQVGATVEVRYDKAHFRCAQDVEGYFKLEGNLLSILVQPVDMNPTQVAGCDCLYTLDMGVSADAASVAVWRRWDNLNDPNDPELIEEVTVVEGPT